MKILIVDDSSFSQKMISFLMKKFLKGAEFFFANDGQEGIDKYKEINPDYILMDLLMPVLNGKELVKLIKEYDANAKIIVISADVQKNVKQEVESLGIVSFINKPFNQKKAEAMCNSMTEKN